MNQPIQKAGGVITRTNNGTTEIYVIHRPRYDDWSIPKGHIDAGESPRDAALREVREETGLVCEVLRPLQPHLYNLPTGEQCETHYFEMRVLEEGAPTDSEADEGKWIPAGQLHDVLSYPNMVTYVRWAITG
jgi:8-oxo-dGTP diphosphatase